MDEILTDKNQPKSTNKFGQKFIEISDQKTYIIPNKNRKDFLHILNAKCWYQISIFKAFLA